MNVLNGLLYAELTNRVPVVLWLEESLYFEAEGVTGSGTDGNGFEDFFEPVSDLSPSDLAGTNTTYYPECFNGDNVLDSRLPAQVPPLPYSTGGEGRDADVLVSTSFQRIEDVQSMVPKTHSYRGMSKEALWRKLYERYIRLREPLQNQIEDFWSRHMAGGQAVGVHVRSTDKQYEQAAPDGQRFQLAVHKYLKVHPEAKIFLATDSTGILDHFKKAFGDRLLYTDAIRSSDSSAVHLGGGNRKAKGNQILMDMALLSRCNHFIGTLRSNISFVVLYMFNDPAKRGDWFWLLEPGPREKLRSLILRARGRIPARSLLRRMGRVF